MENMKVSDSEYIVLELLWDTDNPMSLGEIHETLSPLYGWKYTTISTFLLRLTAKRAIRNERYDGKPCYVPTLTREQYRAALTKAFVDGCHKGSIKSLMLCLCENDCDTVRLREILAELEGGGEV